MFIENTTPYKGKIKLKFEKFPEYSGQSVLNKIHFDFGFTKLVSRMYPYKTNEGYTHLDPEKVKLIVENTGGLIGVHEWWECVSKNTGRRKKTYKKPNTNVWEIIFHGKLPESFVSEKDNTYIGDVERGWWYYQNNLRVCQEHPYGVALEVDKFKKITGVYGYSHRGGAMFEIGHRVFNGHYDPKKEDYPKWQWLGFVMEMNSGSAEYLLDGEYKQISDYIPFNLRGTKVIETWEEAIEAAKNLSEYLG